jgi:hypothetical protein
MKLYKVTIEHAFLMVAKNDLDAQLNAESAAREAVRNDFGIEVSVGEEVTAREDIPKDWIGCCPYGEGGDAKRCEEWLPAVTS